MSGHPKHKMPKSTNANKLLATMRAQKQVSNFMLPDAPESKKGKGKRRKTDTTVWIPCPLLPGIPEVPPPRKSQPWEVQRSEAPSTSKMIPGPCVSTMSHKIASSTSKMAPGSCVSTMSHEIDVNMKRELPAESGDSDIEAEDVDNGEILRTRDVFEYPAVLDEIDDPLLSMEVINLGLEDDVGLRALADPDDGDIFNFDWHGDVDNFQGVRETFSGPSGPTFDVTGLTPLDIFEKIWDANIIDHIVQETNRYAHQTQLETANKGNSRMSRWRDTSNDEILKFFSILMLQSLIKNDVEREYWYPINQQLKIGDLEKIMSYNRFVLLKRCLHFVDNTDPLLKKDELHKVMPIINHLNHKFGDLYIPEQNVAIDESLFLWKGRLSFARLIATKRATVCFKSYELCESRTGYLWRMDLYFGKGHHVPQEGKGDSNDPDSATSQIVFNLMRPLFGKGHTLVMDNFYNAPLLSRLLKARHRTDSMGTLRLSRDFVPETLKEKNKKSMRPGEVCFSSTKDLNIVVWRGKNVVAMISTFHRSEVGGKEKFGFYKYKPQVVLDYNLFMAGVDLKDKMLHAFPVERVGNQSWYKNLFRRLLNVSIHNAFVIFNHHRPRLDECGNRQFRQKLVIQMLEKYSPESLNLVQQTPVVVSTMSTMHLPAKNTKTQRCKACAAANVRRTTVWRCSTCNVNLCIEGCYTSYHTNLCAEIAAPN